MRAMLGILGGLIAATQTFASSSVAEGTKNITARVVTAEQRKECEYLGLITYRQAIGWNKAGGALKHALRKVQQMGGDSLYIIGEHEDLFAGASVNGEALRCAHPDVSIPQP